MVFYAFIGLITIYILFKGNPKQSKELVTQAHACLKYLPIDKTLGSSALALAVWAEIIQAILPT